MLAGSETDGGDAGHHDLRLSVVEDQCPPVSWSGVGCCPVEPPSSEVGEAVRSASLAAEKALGHRIVIAASRVQEMLELPWMLQEQRAEL